MEDDLFTLDTVRDFILSRGGKITNHELVTHFKTILNDPRRKGANRGKFKDFVNTLATVKLDESGEKVLVLKKKFRDGAVHSAPAPSMPERVLDRPKRNKDPSVLQRAPPQVTAESTEDETPMPKIPRAEEPFQPAEDFSEAAAEESSSSSRESSTFEGGAAGGGEPGLAETLESETSAMTVETESSVPEELSSPEDEPVREDVSEASAVEMHSPVNDETPAPQQEYQEMAPTPREPTPPPEVVEEPQVEPEQATEAMAEPSGGFDDASMPPPRPPPPQTPTSVKVAPQSGSLSAEKSKQSMSVKERARHINKIQSESDLLHSAPKKHKEKRRDKGSEDKGEDDSGMKMTLDDDEREWMLKSVAADYHPMAKILLTRPQLAKRKDFITGCTALHWAAKHGNMDVIKLLCGTPGIQVNCKSNGGYTPLHFAALHGHEDVIELLVQAYGADPNIRDYSGKKAKQYLSNSASARTQQILSARKPQTYAAFRRVGSYSSKIQKAGYFGIGTAATVRNSWASNASDTSDTNRSSPSPSPSPGDSPRTRRKGSLRDTDLMPPPTAAGIKKKKSKRGKESGASSDSELQRSESNPDMSQGMSSSKSMFI